MESREEFRPIKGFENYYVSDKGNIFSKKTNKLLNPWLDTKGYLGVELGNNHGKKKFRVHQLVANAFLEKTAETVNHIDGNKQNNNLRNLEWATNSEQQIHAFKMGLNSRKKGKENKRSKPVLQFDLEMNFIKEWECANEIKRELGFNQGAISQCCLGYSQTSYRYIWKYK